MSEAADRTPRAEACNTSTFFLHQFYINRSPRVMMRENNIILIGPSGRFSLESLISSTYSNSSPFLKVLQKLTGKIFTILYP